MKKVSGKTRKILLGTVLAVCLVTGTVFANAIQKQITATLDPGVKVVLDGKEVGLTDANGKNAIPILYNGTTYLPVRAVSNALGLSVNWDDKNKMVILNSTNKEVGENEANKSYQLIEETYTNKYEKINVKIKYPQIINLGDAVKQKNINQIIKDEAIALYEKTLSELDDSSSYEADVSYEIKLKNDKILSIAYSSYNNIVPSAHPYFLFHTTNIDLTNGKEMTLADIVPKMNEDFVKALRNAKYVGMLSSDPQAVKYAKSYAFGEISDSELLKLLLNKAASGEIYGYLTKDGVGISVPVGHALGDHAEFEISNSELPK